VAAPEHTLCFSRSDVSETELRSHRQLVLRDSGSRRNVDAGWLKAEKRWTVSHFATSIKLLKSGLAFAFVPKRMDRGGTENGVSDANSAERIDG